MINVAQAVAILVIILVLYGAGTMHTSTYEDYLYGAWIAEGDDFCEDSEIASMTLFIGAAERGWTKTTRQGYLIIMNDLCNQGLTLTYRRGWSGPFVSKYTISAHVEMDDEQLWPSDVTIEIDMRSGLMRIHDGETVYARLYKQNEITALARGAEHAEVVETAATATTASDGAPTDKN
jgi:hypothetical protein